MERGLPIRSMSHAKWMLEMAMRAMVGRTLVRRRPINSAQSLEGKHPALLTLQMTPCPIRCFFSRPPPPHFRFPPTTQLPSPGTGYRREFPVILDANPLTFPFAYISIAAGFALLSGSCNIKSLHIAASRIVVDCCDEEIASQMSIQSVVSLYIYIFQPAM